MVAIANLVHQSSSSTGTGDFTLASVNGKQTFSDAFGTGGSEVFFYFVSNRGAAEYEWGLGHMSDATTLVRDTVQGGTNGTSAVSFSAGTKDVTNALPVDEILRLSDYYTKSAADAAFQPLDADLTSLAALGSAADKIAYTTGAHTWAETALTSTARGLLDDTSTSAMRTTLGLVIGTDVQAHDADLDAIAGVSSSGLIARTGAGTAAARTITGTSNQIAISNGSGAGGDPTISAVVASQAEAEAGTDTTKLMTAQRVAQAIAALGGGGGGGGPMFNCRLSKVSSNLQLDCCSGNYLFIDGVNETIPSGGVTLAATGLSSGTTYYIYAFMNSGMMTLEASTTGWAVDSTYGHPIKSGDDSRTLVGMARPVTGPAWADTATQRFVVSNFNRRGLSGVSHFSTDRTTSSSSFAELNSEIRVEFLTWADETALVALNGALKFPNSTPTMAVSIGFDGTTAEDASAGFIQNSTTTQSFAYPIGTWLAKSGLSEGYHYATLLGKTSSGSITLLGSATVANPRCSLNIDIRG